MKRSLEENVVCVDICWQYFAEMNEYVIDIYYNIIKYSITISIK